MKTVTESLLFYLGALLTIRAACHEIVGTEIRVSSKAVNGIKVGDCVGGYS